MVTNAGSYSRWNGSRSRAGAGSTRDNWGSFCYIRDLASATVWSTAYQPTLKRPEHYEAIFSEGRAEFRRHDALDGAAGTFETYTEIVVSPEDDIGLRRTKITNRSQQRRAIEITSYAEVAIAPPAADDIHPAFSKLFVQTEILAARNAVLCYPSPALCRRASAVDAAPGGGAWGHVACRFCANRSCAFHRSWQQQPLAAGHEHARRTVWHRWFGA